MLPHTAPDQIDPYMRILECRRHWCILAQMQAANVIGEHSASHRWRSLSIDGWAISGADSGCCSLKALDICRCLENHSSQSIVLKHVQPIAVAGGENLRDTALSTKPSFRCHHRKANAIINLKRRHSVLRSRILGAGRCQLRAE